ncbi:HET-domain-containing protein [Paraphaeosphaeria sporulosa]|uniref:HET-domain-containing protein n=1 Tax=Paraphaeosphaeria sporulosa TaxID=1460663 RepID=A0A177CZ80_9PLEO|nr:HET-domain-containing protein [Paraphaeosphaeria sporulosa]OAG12813.1 HET-domain-containing protein [Paraphaeosphaeria sporulosa]
MRRPLTKLKWQWFVKPTRYNHRRPLLSVFKARLAGQRDKHEPTFEDPHDPQSKPNCSARREDPLTSPFRYDRLNWASNEIRLIKILPGNSSVSVNDDGPIACEIISVSLKDKPQYIALSYAWGDTALTRPLILNGRLLHATASLDTALRQIRKMQLQGTTYQDQLFWIDALSINQEDEIEKSWQVQRMNAIFSAARYALVWLGPSVDDSDKAMEALEHVGLQVASGSDPLDNATLNTFHLLSTMYNEFSHSVRKLLMRSWWRRIWVVQEFASARDVVFQCGDVQIAWRPCMNALEVLERFQKTLAEKGWRGNIGGQNYQQLMSEISSISGILRLFRIRQVLKQNQKRLLLWELLTLKRFGMLSSDDRDFIYALTGIAEDAGAKHLYPDYTKHVAKIYTEVAKCFLAEGRLRTLWLCSHPRRIVGLPSWVPDWSSTWQSNRRYFSGDSGYGSGSTIFSASGDSPPDVSFSSRNDRMVLHLEGYRLDTVTATKSAFDMDHTLQRGGFFRAQLALQGRYRAFWELQRSSWKNLFRACVTDIEPVWGADLHFNYRRSTPQMRQELYGELAHATDESGGFEASWRLPASRLDILYRHNGRRPFITSKGLLGLGPEDMRSGDVVVVVSGAEVPFILREAPEGGYVLVGEAYVDGVMDGEVLSMGLEKVTLDIL